jgi:ribosomal protein L34
MKRRTLCTALAAAVSLCACDFRGRSDETDNKAADAEVSAEGKAEEGKISLKMPGVDMTISLPKGVADEARAERDSKLLYPGAILRGMAIAAGPGSDKSGDSEVEIRFSSPDPVDTVADWYRHRDRADGFRLEHAAKEGDSWVVTGVQKRDKHGFRLRLSPRDGGGTDGRLAVRHRD